MAMSWGTGEVRLGEELAVQLPGIFHRQRGRLLNMLLEFVDACRSQWKHQTDGLSPEQIAWLAWARAIATDLSPFSIGYPDMAKEPNSESGSNPQRGLSESPSPQ